MSKVINKALLEVAEAVANEKGVNKNTVFDAIQSALESATRKRHGAEFGVRVALDLKTGSYETFRYWEVLPDDEIEFPDRQLTLEEAKARDASLEIGSRIEEPMESVEFGRIAAQAAKQVMMQKVREAERHIIVSDYESKIGELVIGVVKRVMRESIILDLGGKVEALLPRSETLPQENFRMGDRVRAYLYKVQAQQRGPQITVSRTCPEMLIELFRIEVPEVGEDVIEIKAAARDPGNRAKIAVKTNDGRIDPVGACVGMRGSRVQAVSGELSGERVDIILWDEDPAQFVVKAMEPAEIVSIVVDEDSNTMDLAVSEEQLSQAIGRSGQNIRLASELTGWTLNVMTEEAFAQKSDDESTTVTTLFTEALEIDEDIAALLIEAGFSTLEEIAYVPQEELLAIEDFDEEIAGELQARANDILLGQALSGEGKAKPADDLLAMEGMEALLAQQLADKGLITMEDLAEQSVDDLLEIVDVDAAKAAQLILKAREPWFEQESES